jgi:hypothetical protein
MPITLDSALENRWKNASDADVLRAAFPPGSGWANTALACVYHEFVTRELDPPRDVKYVPPEYRTTFGEDLKAYVIATMSFTAFFAASIALLYLVGNIAPSTRLTDLLVFAAFVLWLPEFAALHIFRCYFLRNHQKDRFTRCGVCGYILRGLTEPRCPECGERF